MASDPEKLVLLPMLRAARLPGGRVGLTEKFVDGVLEMQAAWGGPVKLVMEPVEEESHNLDNVAVDPKTAPYEVELADFRSPRLRDHLRDAAVVLGGTSDRQNHLADVCAEVGVPCVYGTEYTLLTRMQITNADTQNPLVRLRRYVWHSNQELKQRVALRRAAGVQCNGTPTYDAYRGMNRSPLLFFDTRVRESMLATTEQLERKLARRADGRPLHLAFSGRLDPMKGPQHLPAIAAELRRREVPFEMSICGGGSLADSLRDDIRRLGLERLVKMKGVLDFKTELIPFVREEVDVFVCTHVQGDPSCTYLETASCGVPILGFDNEAWAGIHERHAIGWSTPMADVSAAADAIERLDQDRAGIARAARASLELARRHTFEQTVRRRMDHLRAAR